MKANGICQRCGVNNDKGKRLCEECETEVQSKYNNAELNDFQIKALKLNDELKYEVKDDPVKLAEWNIKAQTLLVFAEINNMANG